MPSSTTIENAEQSAVMLLAIAQANDAPVSLDLPGGISLTVFPHSDLTFLATFFILLGAGAHAQH